MDGALAIVVVNWNGYVDTLECLASLEALEYVSNQTIVVDNGSTDGSEGIIREAHPDAIVIQAGTNLGFAGGTNIGLKHAIAHGADYIWLLNNDTVVEPTAATHLIARMRQHPRAGMCGSTLVYYHDRERVQALAGASYNKWLGTTRHIGQDWPRSRAVDTARVEAQLDYIVAASLLVSREFVEQVGLLSEEYFLYYEELDWATRAKGRYALVYAAESLVYHKEGASTGSSNSSVSNKSKLADYYGIRSRLLFTRKFHPEARPAVYFGLLLTIANRILRNQWDRVGMILELAWQARDDTLEERPSWPRQL